MASKNMNIKNYPSDDHIMYNVIQEILRYFTNLQDKTLSEHPKIAFDEYYAENYIENHFDEIYSKYFNNENNAKNNYMLLTGYFK